MAEAAAATASLVLEVSLNGSLEGRVRPVRVEYRVGGARRRPVAATVTEMVSLDERSHATIVLEDVAGETDVLLRWLSEGGVTLASQTLRVAGGSKPVSVVLDARSLPSVRVPPDTSRVPVRRAARLVSSTSPIPYRRSLAMVARWQGTATEWRKLGLDRLFGAEQPTSGSIACDRLPDTLASLAWEPVRLGVDGRFVIELERRGQPWLWRLDGPVRSLGVVLEAAEDDASATPTTLALQITANELDAADVADDAPSATTFGSEAEIADNPAAFVEDPGSACQPFSSPERVLGEKSFSVILRVEQPALGAPAKIESAAPLLIDFDPPAAQPPTPSRRPGLVASVRPETPIAGYAQPLGGGAGRVESSATHPLPWEADVSRFQATTVARGHVLEYRLRWRANGYSLGNVVKTLTLAPRQSKRIQRIEFTRRERAEREESQLQSDRVGDQLDRERSYEDSVQANIQEWAFGSSNASMMAAAAGVGFAKGGFVVGGGGVASTASSASSQTGGRELAASEEQRLRDSIRRFADAQRAFQSVVINEVAQTEEVTGTTEVIRNANYAHSLTVVYYQILRHLRIDTELAGARECLFVPFAIRPFTPERAFRWRESIGRMLRDRAFEPALRRLRDVVADFEHSDVPAGRRSDQPVRQISGSIQLSLGIALPSDGAEGAFDPEAWAVLAPLLRAPAAALHAQLHALAPTARQELFQRRDAQSIAALWADRLVLDVAGGPIAADFTMVGRYAFNRPVRIDFSATLPEGSALTREKLATLRVRADRRLPAGSVANVVSASYRYVTDSFTHSVAGAIKVDDLIEPQTGMPDQSGALIGTPPSQWERRNERDDIRRAVADLLQHLNEHVEHYHKAIWWQMDRDRLLMLLDGFEVPRTNGVSIASIVERDPIAISGNCLVYRVSAGSFLGIDDLDTSAKLDAWYRKNQPASDPMLASFPTDGVYARTLMDECEALEEHFGNLDWVLDQPDLELGEIAPDLLQSRRAEPASTTPSQLPQTIINLQNAPDAPLPSGLAGALGAVTNAGAFRDMAGLAGTQANAAAAAQTAAGLATNFGNQAAALEMARIQQKKQAAKNTSEKLAAVKRARDQGLIDEEQANDVSMQIMEDEFATSSYSAPLPSQEAIDEEFRATPLAPGMSKRVVTPHGSYEASYLPTTLPLPIAAAPPASTHATRAAEGLYGDPDFWPDTVFIADPKSSIVYVPDPATGRDAYLTAAVRFHDAQWKIPTTKVGTLWEFFEKAGAKVSSKMKRVRFVLHAAESGLALPMFSKTSRYPYVFEDFLVAMRTGDIDLVEYMIPPSALVDLKEILPLSGQSRRDNLVDVMADLDGATCTAFGLTTGSAASDELERALYLRASRLLVLRAAADPRAKFQPGIGNALRDAFDYLVEKLNLPLATGKSAAEVTALFELIDRAFSDGRLFSATISDPTEADAADIAKCLELVKGGKLRPVLSKLANAFAGLALDIRGCNIGENDGFMVAFSRLVGADSVTAPDAYQGWSGTKPIVVEVTDAQDFSAKVLGEHDYLACMSRFAEQDFAAAWSAASETDKRALFYDEFIAKDRIFPIYAFAPGAEATRLYMQSSAKKASLKNFLGSLWILSPDRKTGVTSKKDEKHVEARIKALVKEWDDSKDPFPDFPALCSALSPELQPSFCLPLPDPGYGQHIVEV